MTNPSPGQGSKKGAESEKVASISAGGITWTDIPDPTTDDTARLARDYHFHSLDLDDCLSTRPPTKIEDHGEHIFISLSFPDQVDRGDIVSRHISMFLGKDYLVTLHPSDFKTIPDLFRSCKDDEKIRNESMKSSAYLAYQVVDRLVDGLFPILENVQVSLDSIEAVVFNETKSSAVPINLTASKDSNTEKDRLSAGAVRP